MTLLPTGWIKMPGDNDETKRFAWSHVKSIFYNKAANVLLKDKLDEMDKIIDEKIAKALMSNVQVNDQSKIPTSALAYAMQQSITKNGQDIAKLNSDLKVSYGSYVPVFSWSDDNSHPIVDDIETRYVIMSKICFVYTRYNITDLVKTDRRNCYLQVSLPEGVKSITTIVPLVSPYFQNSNEYSKLGTRISGDKVWIADGIGGDYSGNLIKTGYQGFAVFFMRE